MNSLRLRLVILLIAGLIVLWGMTAWLTLREARHEVDKLFDAQLAESAQVLLGTALHELHENQERGDEDIPVFHEYEQKQTFQIWGDGKLVARSVSAPSSPLASQKPGYADVTIGRHPWRVFTRWDKYGDFMIQVAKPLESRERLARHITHKMLLPTLGTLPLIALLVWVAVGTGLEPLQRLRQEIRQRTADRLEPMANAGVPDEVVPLVQALNDLFARLEHAFEGERRFTADAAHELRTPLAALKTQVQVAFRASENAERQAALENVLRGVDRATHLLEQLLTLARVDPEAAGSSHEPVALRGLAAAALAEISPLAHSRRIELSLEEGPTGNIDGNSAQLAVLLRNLLDNAVRYTPAGGSVSVAIHAGDGVTLEVLDTGPGIPADERSRTLERFYRIPGSGVEGSGLGLSIVRRIAELHHARIELSDNPYRQGLRVGVVFPAQE